MLNVHVRVNDETTGRPVPVRLRITDTTGREYPPLGRLREFAIAPGLDVGGQVRLGNESYSLIDGTCEVPLPPGTLSVEADRGPEYVPVSQRIDLAAGKMAMRFSIGRWTDWQAEGWYSGDVRAHELTPHAAVLEGAAAGLAVVQLQIRERPPSSEEPGAIGGLEAFSGTGVALDAHGCQVVVNTLNSHPVLGTVSLLDSHRPVFPLRSGKPGLPDDWSVADWCDQCHRKKGFVVWPDLPRLCAEHPQGEALAALILGKIDAFELGPLETPVSPKLLDYYRLLDCGLRPVLVGGSGKDSNSAMLGSMRTYAHLLSRQDEDAKPQAGMTHTAWLDAVRAGRTFITTAPLLKLSVADSEPGSVLRVEKGQRVRLRAEATSGVPISYLDLIVNGEVQASKPASGNQTSALLETDLVCERSSWIAAVCYSDSTLRSGACIFAHTNAVFVEVAGESMRPSADSVDPLLRILHQTRDWVEREADSTEKQRRHVVEILDEASRKLAGLRG